MGISPFLSFLHNCSFRVAIHHQNVLDMLPFICQGRLLFANPFGSVVGSVYYIRLYHWMVVRAVVEIAVSMGWLPVDTGGQFSPIFLLCIHTCV